MDMHPDHAYESLSGFVGWSLSNQEEFQTALHLAGQFRQQQWAIK
jgi:hypothetical protein